MVARRRGSRKSANNASLLRPVEAEICVAIKSLYADELKPFGRLLRRRLHERAVANARADDEALATVVPDVDMEHTRSVCEKCPLISVEPETAGDWSALLLDWPSTSFVEIDGPDVYSGKFWLAVATELQTLDADGGLEISGGRYACAVALSACSLPSLVSCSLGRVSHIIQLALADKQILGYRGGAIVLYDRSNSKVKEQSANSQQACDMLGQGISSVPLATWDVARSCLQSILKQHSAHAAVALSRVKSIFRSNFGVELSETKLGHSKLSELFQDQRFSDVCSIQLEESGYCLYPVEEHAPPKRTADIDNPRTEAKSCSDSDGDCAAQRAVRSRPEPLSLADVSIVGMPRVKNTFIHFPLASSTPLVGTALRRASSVPRSALTSIAMDTDAGTYSAHSSLLGGFPFSPVSTPSPQSFSQHVHGPETTDLASVLYFQDRVVAASGEACVRDVQCENVSCGDVSCQLGSQHRQAEFCSDEPLEPTDVELAPVLRRVVTLSIDIKNTFIEAPAPPFTPLPTHARRRARSVPKDMGSSGTVEGGYATEATSSGFMDRISVGPSPMNWNDCMDLISFGPSPMNWLGPPTPTCGSLAQLCSDPNPQQTFGNGASLHECHVDMWLSAGWPQMVLPPLPFLGCLDPICSTTDCSCESTDESTDACSTASPQTQEPKSDAVFLSLVDALGAIGTELCAHSGPDSHEVCSRCNVGERAGPPLCMVTKTSLPWSDEKDDTDEDADSAKACDTEVATEDSRVCLRTNIRSTRRQRRRKYSRRGSDDVPISVFSRKY